MTENSGPGEGRRGEDGQAAPRLPAPGGDPAGGVRSDRVTEVLAAVSGIWAVPVLRHLASGVSRPGDLLRAINARPGTHLRKQVMHGVLDRLREHGLVSRTEVPGFPPETHYWLTHEGHTVLTDISKIGAPGFARWPAMGHEDQPAPFGVDTSTPSTARVWNALIGGKDNYEVDRVAMRAVLAEMPSLAEAARLTRRFQDAAVRALVDRGVRQFLDIGTGLPVAGAVHETAQRLAPESRVVYLSLIHISEPTRLGMIS